MTSSVDQNQDERLLTSGEVGKLFRVDAKTVSRWAARGVLGSVRTVGGHRRFRETDVRALMDANSEGGQHEMPALEEFARWVVTLENPDRRQKITFQEIVESARAALSRAGVTL